MDAVCPAGSEVTPVTRMGPREMHSQATVIIHIPGDKTLQANGIS